MVKKPNADPNKYFNLVYNLRQGTKDIVDYVEETKRLHAKCPIDLKNYLEHQFVTGLTDDRKIDLVQMYLGDTDKISFPEAKVAVIKAYRRIGRPSPFDKYEDDRTQPSTEVTQTQVNAGLLSFFEALKVQSKTATHEATPPRKPMYVTPPKGQEDETFHKGIYCHNCTKEGHFSSSCQEPRVTYRQRELNKAQVEGIQAGLAPAAAAAMKGKAQEVLEEVSGNTGRMMAKMGNANAVILRRAPKPTIEDEDQEDSDGEWAGVANAVTRDKGKGKATEEPPVIRRTEDKNRASKHAAPNKPEEKASKERKRKVAEELLQKRTGGKVYEIPEEVMDIDAEEAIPPIPPPVPPVPPIPPPVPPMQGESSRGQEQPSQDTVREPESGQQRLTWPQRKMAPKAKAEDANYAGPKETVPINMTKSKERFDVGSFLDVPVTMTIWQLLDRSPQIRAQLARAMASSKPSKRGRKTATAVSQLVLTVKQASLIETMAYEEQIAEVVCLYIKMWVGDTLIPKTLVDFGSVVELINRRLITKLELSIYDMKKTWTLQLTDDGYVEVKKYVWVSVNAAEVNCIMKAFILGDGMVYDLLLSKR